MRRELDWRLADVELDPRTVCTSDHAKHGPRDDPHLPSHSVLYDGGCSESLPGAAKLGREKTDEACGQALVTESA